MKNGKKFLFLRISIYLTGIVVLATVLFFNIWEIKQKKEVMTQSSTKPENFFSYTKSNYQDVKIDVLYSKKPRNPQPRIAKTLSIFLQEEKTGVYYKDELQDKLTKNNNSQYPNGSLLEYNNTVYLLEEGELRKITSPDVFQALGYKWEQIKKINQKEFNSFSISKHSIDLKALQDPEKFPEDIIIKDQDKFYITGGSSYYPLYLKKEKIEELWPKFTYASASKFQENNSIPLKCYETKNEKIIACQAKLEEINREFGNIYQINTPSSETPEKIKIELKRNLTAPEIWENIKKLFTKQ
jgi:hypothetical protein